jgi:hypothetical protein
MRTAALSDSAAICIKISDKIHKYIVNCDFSVNYLTDMNVCIIVGAIS